jgi:hypothetical protein
MKTTLIKAITIVSILTLLTSCGESQKERNFERKVEVQIENEIYTPGDVFIYRVELEEKSDGVYVGVVRGKDNIMNVDFTEVIDVLEIAGEPITTIRK